jgi:molecular chaperone GrpE
MVKDEEKSNKEFSESQEKEQPVVEAPNDETITPKESSENLKIQMEDYKNKYLRALAEIENSRKRLQKEKEETMSFVIEKTIAEFLPAIDNMENALNYAKVTSDEVKNWAIGFQMILTQFKEILLAHGIVAFHSIGCMFDPSCHEVIEIIETDKEPEGKILEEITKGYKSNVRVLRPAHVKVAKKPQNPSNKEKNNE